MRIFFDLRVILIEVFELYSLILMTFSSSGSSGNVIHLFHHTRETACVGKYWFCEVMIQRELILYKNIGPLESNLDLPDNTGNN